MSILLEARPIVEKFDKYLSSKVRELGFTPVLKIFLFSDDEPSSKFVKNKQRIAQKLGIKVEVVHKPNIKVDKAVELLRQASGDSNVHGIILQLPVNKHLRPYLDRLIANIATEKDVDLLNPLSWTFLYDIEPKVYPVSVFVFRELLNYYHLDLKGKNVAIVGVGKLIGRPIANYLSYVKSVNSIKLVLPSADLKQALLDADVIISGVGQKHLLNKENLPKESVVFDFGTSVVNGNTFGDVDWKNVLDHVKAVTPTPGGTGPVTVYGVLYNLVEMVGCV